LGERSGGGQGSNVTENQVRTASDTTGHVDHSDTTANTDASIASIRGTIRWCREEARARDGDLIIGASGNGARRLARPVNFSRPSSIFPLSLSLSCVLHLQLLPLPNHSSSAARHSNGIIDNVVTAFAFFPLSPVDCLFDLVLL
jgi:hypothetical protein